MFQWAQSTKIDCLIVWNIMSLKDYILMVYVSCSILTQMEETKSLNFSSSQVHSNKLSSTMAFLYFVH